MKGNGIMMSTMEKENRSMQTDPAMKESSIMMKKILGVYT